MNSQPVDLGIRGIPIVLRKRSIEALAWLLAAQLTAFPLAATPAANDKPAAKASPDDVLQAMQKELNRAKTDLAKSDPSPYFISYTAYDQDQIFIVGAYGAAWM